MRSLSARRPLAWRWWLPALALGLLAGQSAGGDTAVLLLALAATTAAPALCRLHRRRGTALALAALAALVGALQIRHQDAARLARAGEIGGGDLAGGPASLHARVASVRALRGRSGSEGAALDLEVRAAATGLAAGDRVRLNVWRTSRAWRAGDELTARVPALRSPRGFCNRGDDGYARAAWRQGIVATASLASDRTLALVRAARPGLDLGATIDATRRAIAAALAGAVPDDAARAVLAALIYGDQTDIPAALRQAYARTGTAHVLSVSGLHIAVVALTCFALASGLLVRCEWLALRVLVVRPAALLALAPAGFYALLSGGAVATLRSLVMAALALGGVLLLRRADVVAALAAAALLLGAVDPGVGAEASFQLSFAAVAALVAAGRWLAGWRARRTGRWLDARRRTGRIAGRVLAALVAAVAAGVATGPITAYHFGSVALLGVLANLVVVPLVGTAALLLGLGGAVLLPASTTAAHAALALAARCIAPANAFVSWLARLRWCALDVALASPVEVVALLALAAAPLASRTGTRRMVLVLAAVLGLARGAVVLAERSAPELVVRFLDVGQGDALLVRLPGTGSPSGGVATRRTLLVDAGGLGGAFDPGERVVLPALRRDAIAALDAIALSHADFDHYGGLAAVVRALPVDAFWSSGRGSTNPTFARLRAALAEAGVPERRLAAAMRPLPGALAEVTVVQPRAASAVASDNDASLVLRIVYGASRVLLTGDVEAAAEATLSRAPGGVAATVVKVPHHGSRTSSSRGLVAAVQPALAVASLGANNRFHFPAPEVRERWQRAGARWLATDRDGEVVLTSDGQLERVATCR